MPVSGSIQLANGGSTRTLAVTAAGTFDPASPAPHAAAPLAPATARKPMAVPFRPLVNGRGANHAALAAAAQGNAAPGAASARVNAGNAAGPQAPGTGFDSRSFEGISAVDSAAANGGFELTPPDEGACASNRFVGEIVNPTLRFINSDTGAALTPDISEYTFFNEGSPATVFPIGDGRCLFDAPSTTWFASALAQHNDTGRNFVDLAVNHNANPASPWTLYHIDVTDLGITPPCFGDQPLLGVDAYLVAIEVNQYCADGFEGGQMILLSKAQLVAGNPTPNTIVAGPYVCSLDGVVFSPCGSFQPASNQAAAAATHAFYFAFTFDPTGSSGNTVWLLAWTHEAKIDQGQSPDFSGGAITSETYNYPVPVRQWGSSLTVDAGDDRMQSADFLGGTIWASAATAVTPFGDSAVRDGAAWFALRPQLDPSNSFLSAIALQQQGIVAASGYYVTYPAIAATHTDNGSEAVLALQATGPNLFPSAAYSRQGTGITPFGNVTLFGRGSTPFGNFDASSAAPMRDGDYSAAVALPGSGRILVGAQYARADKTANFTNWDNRLAIVDLSR
ncbi:MAG TPA: hypothetical protein VFD32_23470 [Dehalococcoidia bacterium]|nr:hypothetical protein [Dehalococcoidia bacterium]